MAESSTSQLQELLTLVRQKPSYAIYQQVGARLLGIESLPEVAETRRLRIAVLSSFTIDPIKPYLQIDCLERGIHADIFLPGFNQFAQQILTPDSDLYRFNPDVCFLHVLPEAVIDGLEPSGIQEGQVEELVEALSGLVTEFRSRCPGDLVVSNLSDSGRFPYSLQANRDDRAYAKANAELERVAEGIAGVHILDFESLSAFQGKSSVADERLRHIARMELSQSFLAKLAKNMLAYVLAIRGLGRKCIVVDLDDTLWGGVVGEDGPSGIQLSPEYPGSAFLEFQRSLLVLQQRGILLAINSKNNEADALEVLAEHPSMVLRPEHFAASQINWRDKCENIEAIASELNLGLESMVFIDDNPAERELMRRLRPEVLTPEWPADVVSYRGALESLSDFGNLSVTAEDLNRGEMYASETRREEVRNRSASLEDYLFGLKMEVFINQAEVRDDARFHQLVNKTNQFNLTTRRYSASDVESFLKNDDVHAYVLRNQDAFGDNGLVGIAVVVRDGQHATEPAWRIDSFLMSCRVLGRTIETGFLNHILMELKTNGCRYVLGDYLPTSKNAMVKDFYAKAGFGPGDVTENAERWIMDLADYTPPQLPWLDINPLAVEPAKSL